MGSTRRNGNTLTAAIGLSLALMVAPAGLFGQQEQQSVQREEPRQIELTILGMSCPFCAYGVEQKLKRLEGVEDLEVKLKSGLATLTLAENADISNERLKKVVDDAGFEVAKIVRNFQSEHPDYEREPKSGGKG